MKWLSNPNDLSIFLSPAAEGTRVQLHVTWEYGKATGKLLEPLVQGKLKKVRERIANEAGGIQSAPPPLPQSVSRALQPESLPSPPSTATKERIFISYRRSDSADVTGRIYDRLIQHFGEGTVFQDVEDIPLGMDFAEFILQVVGKCDAFLAIIGDEWLAAKDRAGSRRLHNSADNVRIEIEKRTRPKNPAHSGSGPRRGNANCGGAARIAAQACHSQRHPYSTKSRLSVQYDALDRRIGRALSRPQVGRVGVAVRCHIACTIENGRPSEI